MTADCCMEGDRAEAERGCPKGVDAHARWKPEREAEEKRRRRGRRTADEEEEQTKTEP